LVAEKNYFKIFAEITNEFIFILNEQGIIRFVNNYGCKILNKEPSEIKGKHFFEIVSNNSKETSINAFQKILTTQSDVTVNLQLVSSFGKEFDFSFNMHPIIENKKPYEIIGVGTNITTKTNNQKKIEELNAKLTEAYRLNSIERDRAEEQINILNELNRLKNEFISNVSHELRTPLASIIGFSETIAEDKKLTIKKVKEFNEIILTESKRLAKLINDVLDFSELEHNKKQLTKNSVNIISLLKNIIKHFEKKFETKKITFTGNLPESEVIIYADEKRLSKAINYLISNAIKFTQTNGRITLTVKEFLKEIEIVISDTGIGIPEEHIPFLFDKFSKANQKGYKLPGTGFSLLAVKQIIDLHKGLIRVKSKINKGTSFIIKLPKYKFE